MQNTMQLYEANEMLRHQLKVIRQYNIHSLSMESNTRYDKNPDVLRYAKQCNIKNLTKFPRDSFYLFIKKLSVCVMYS